MFSPRMRTRSIGSCEVAPCGKLSLAARRDERKLFNRVSCSARRHRLLPRRSLGRLVTVLFIFVFSRSRGSSDRNEIDGAERKRLDDRRNRWGKAPTETSGFISVRALFRLSITYIYFFVIALRSQKFSCSDPDVCYMISSTTKRNVSRALAKSVDYLSSIFPDSKFYRIMHYLLRTIRT